MRRTYRAKVSVKVGPVEVSYRAVITVESLDDATHTAKFHVKGDEARGRGGVTADVVSTATESNGKTHVALHTDAQISGIIATVGGRLIEAVAQKTVAAFAVTWRSSSDVGVTPRPQKTDPAGTVPSGVLSL